MADAFLRYGTLEKRVRSKEEKLLDWEKVQQKGCTLSDMVLAFKLLQSSKLSDVATKLRRRGITSLLTKASQGNHGSHSIIKDQLNLATGWCYFLRTKVSSSKLGVF